MFNHTASFVFDTISAYYFTEGVLHKTRGVCFLLKSESE